MTSCSTSRCFETEDLKNFHAQTVKTLGEVDILVNNAGGRKGTADFQETGLETFREGMEFNFMSAVELISKVLPHMREQKGGRIISISSIYGREYGGSIDYMTGKAALIAFSKHLALNLMKENVLVNCIPRGSIDFPRETVGTGSSKTDARTGRRLHRSQPARWEVRLARAPR
ncbi:MAG: hypothetical protein CM1200mP22_06350 [Dehalococcoidia bacterium]|nr:MAG: hypothetical protein CM1200mP22_06350 [Dehalococcoidia bacterium]